MPSYSSGPIENNPVSGIRPTQQVTVKIVNQDFANSSVVLIQGYVLNGSKSLYVKQLFSVGPNQTVTRTFTANFNAFAFEITTDGAAEYETLVSVWGKNAAGQLVTVHRLVSEELKLNNEIQ